MTNAAADLAATRQQQPWVIHATRDAIRHFAWGIGDNNPLWLDPDHAAGSRWGGLIAPPCLLYAVDETTVAPGHAGHRRIYQSVAWTFYDVIRRDAALDASATLIGEDITEDGPVQTGRINYATDGTPVATAITTCLRSTQPTTDFADLPELRYSGEELEAIERAILSEQRRGATPRLWEDTKPGDTLGPLVKGPLSIMDIVAWCAGTSGMVDDDAGFSEGGLHDQMATGPEQVSWAGQMLTDWMGDDAFLHRLEAKLLQPAPLGTTTTITGAVTDCDPVDGKPAVRIDWQATNQGNALAMTGEAVILLPSRQHGPVQLPVSTELEETSHD